MKNHTPTISHAALAVDELYLQPGRGCERSIRRIA